MDDRDGTLTGLMGLAGHCQTMIRTKSERDMIGMNTHSQPMAHQPGGDGSEDSPPRDATGCGHPHADLISGAAAVRQHQQMLRLSPDRVMIWRY